MKNKLVIVFMILRIFEAHAQNSYIPLVSFPCLVNSDFSQFCGIQAYSECNNQVSFYVGTGSCFPESVVNWHNSHGTPQLIVDNNNPIGNYASMYYNNNIGKGEGIFAGFNFYTFQTYIVKIRMLKSEGSTGTFKLFAANNVPEASGLPCSLEPIPTSVIDKTLINSIEVPYNNNDWQVYSFPIKFLDNSGSTNLKYSELWVYPTTSTATKYGMFIDYLSVCPDCEGVITVNSGTIPYGFIQAGYINVGSSTGSGGSGTVFINPSQQTSLYAYNSIDIEHNFDASPTGIGSLIIETTTCPNSSSLSLSESKLLTSPHSTNMKTFSKLFIDEDTTLAFEHFYDKLNLKIRPLPVRSVLNVDFDNANRKIQMMRLVNNLNQVLVENKNIVRTNNGHITFDMSLYVPGTYFLQIQTDNQIINKVIIKQ